MPCKPVWAVTILTISSGASAQEGACCLTEGAGACAITDETICDENFVGWVFLGVGTECADCLFQACCLLDGSCVEMEPFFCTFLEDGQTQGLLSDCGSSACDGPPGSCCIDGVCAVSSEASCLGLGGAYFEDAGCSGLPCDQPAACCLNGACVELMPEACALNSGEPQVGPCMDTPCGLICDINHDGTVDLLDLVILILSWGPCSCKADINGDGVVDVADLVLVLMHWG